MTSHTDGIFLLSRVLLKSRAKYQFVTSLISNLSVLLPTLSQHNSFSASVVSTVLQLPCKQLELLPFVFDLWGI